MAVPSLEGAEVQEGWTLRGVAPSWKRWPASCLALLLLLSPIFAVGIDEGRHRLSPSLEVPLAYQLVWITQSGEVTSVVGGCLWEDADGRGQSEIPGGGGGLGVAGSVGVPFECLLNAPLWLR